jgi:hypothetical protein
METVFGEKNRNPESIFDFVQGITAGPDKIASGRAA